MKTTFSSHSEICHHWANLPFDKKTNGKSNSIFFDNNEIYSYGSHFVLGKMVQHNGRVFTFLNTNSRSVSTAKHQNHLNRAVHTASFRIPFPHNNQFYLSQLPQVRETFIEEIQTLINSQLRANSSSQYFNGAKFIVDQIDELADTFPEFVSRFEVNEIEGFDSARSKAITLQATQVERENKAKEAKAIKERENLSKWLSGEYSGQLYNLPVYLRLSSDYLHIETSHGANVPTKEAIGLLFDLRAGIDCVGIRIGSFTVKECTLDTLTIGCHKIGWDVISAFEHKLCYVL